MAIGNLNVDPDNLPDQGYWVGHQISRAYYEKAIDKKQAIYDLLNIKDYKLLQEKSGCQQMIELK